MGMTNKEFIDKLTQNIPTWKLVLIDKWTDFKVWFWLKTHKVEVEKEDSGTLEDKDIILEIDRETLLQEYIPKDQYEARLKADMVAILTDIQMEIDEQWEITWKSDYKGGYKDGCVKANDIIQQKIDLLQKQTTDNCDNCFNGTTKGGCAVKELMKNKDCKYYMPRKNINALSGKDNETI